jgi:hypothetical protein
MSSKLIPSPQISSLDQHSGLLLYSYGNPLDDDHEVYLNIYSIVTMRADTIGVEIYEFDKINVGCARPLQQLEIGLSCDDSSSDNIRLLNSYRSLQLSGFNSTLQGYQLSSVVIELEFLVRNNWHLNATIVSSSAGMGGLGPVSHFEQGDLFALRCSLAK